MMMKTKLCVTVGLAAFATVGVLAYGKHRARESSDCTAKLLLKSPHQFVRSQLTCTDIEQKGEWRLIPHWIFRYNTPTSSCWVHMDMLGIGGTFGMTADAWQTPPANNVSEPSVAPAPQVQH